MGIETNTSSYAEMATSADRVWQAARLFKAGKASKIIATGDYAKDTTLPLLKEFGVGEDAVSFLDARTTEEEAKGIRELFSRVEHVERVEGRGFDSRVEHVDRVEKGELHLLYLGRRHPLKGVEYLETAVKQIQESSAYSVSLRLCVKTISSAFGEELEKVWEWCDVLVLPTLSENFGLVIAEALERGKRVITTDDAPAWGDSLELGVGSGGVEELRVEEF